MFFIDYRDFLSQKLYPLTNEEISPVLLRDKLVGNQLFTYVGICLRIFVDDLFPVNVRLIVICYDPRL